MNINDESELSKTLADVPPLPPELFSSVKHGIRKHQVHKGILRSSGMAFLLLCTIVGLHTNTRFIPTQRNTITVQDSSLEEALTDIRHFISADDIDEAVDAYALVISDPQ
jgi:hypothetical protein